MKEPKAQSLQGVELVSGLGSSMLIASKRKEEEMGESTPMG